jgi:hypothetical protein
MFNGRRQPSRGGTSRMTRECQVRIFERLGARRPRPEQHSREASATRLRGWARRIRTGESVRKLPDWSYVINSFEVGASRASETLRVRAA